MKQIDENLATTEWTEGWNGRVSLTANSGVQILDFHFDLEATEKFKKVFTENQIENGRIQLIESDEEEDQDVNYSIKATKALEPFWNEWVPIPLFILEKNSQQKIGPIDWCRIRIVDVTEGFQSIDAGTIPVRIQISIDTSISSGNQVYDYLQPTDGDVLSQREFGLKSSFEELTHFLRSGMDPSSDDWEDAWVSEWINHLFEKMLSKLDSNNRPRFKKLDREAKMEGWARYISFVQFIAQKAEIPKIFLLPSPESPGIDNIEVDLILDIGNSRTCGLLVEKSMDASDTDFSNVSTLVLRNLGQPEFCYEGLFESRVEFVNLEFGLKEFSRLSGRNNAFIWPSFVRFGPEAIKLVQGDQGNEAIYGTSSPKRYLWDDGESPCWPFRNNDRTSGAPSSVAPIMSKLTPEGDYIPQLSQDIKQGLKEKRPIERALQPTFSKSSLFGFMVAEIVAHAFVQINSVTYRNKKGSLHKPRRLKRLILTLPTSTPSQEQAIVRSRVNGAIKLVWDRMVQIGQVSENTMPEIILDWDEASCSHIVYLYNEIVSKFDGDNKTFLDVFGRSRQNSEKQNVPSIKIGCIDVGGGTTDVMVTTFYKEHSITLRPQQEFREGFRTAGDDVLKSIIEKIILPQFRMGVEPDFQEVVDQKINELFGPNRIGLDATQRQAKRQFGLRILAPIAQKILEQTSSTGKGLSIKISDIFEQSNKIPSSLQDYINIPIQKLLGSGWTLENQTIDVDYQDLKKIFRDLFYSAFLDIADVLRQLNVDKILLTGRTSMHPEMLNILNEVCPCPPQDIVAMHQYKADWYPFGNYRGLIGDPKSTVVVGAMLITLSDRHFASFRIPDKSFSMKSTVNYIGRMENSGLIRSENVFFKQSSETTIDMPQEVLMESKMFIGSRQFEAERWVTNPLYKLDFLGEPSGDRPYKVVLQRKEPYDLDEDANSNEKLVAEATKEHIEIESIEDAEGNDINKKEVTLKFRTLGLSDEYWLDTGAFITNEL